MDLGLVGLEKKSGPECASREVRLPFGSAPMSVTSEKTSPFTVHSPFNADNFTGLESRAEDLIGGGGGGGGRQAGARGRGRIAARATEACRTELPSKIEPGFGEFCLQYAYHLPCLS